MPTLKTELFAMPKENEKYVISVVEQVEVKDRTGKTYDALKVSMNSVDKQDKKLYTLTLWLTDEASSTSKLGSFISAFDDFFKGKENAHDTDTWVGHIIQIKLWKERQRVIEVTA